MEYKYVTQTNTPIFMMKICLQYLYLTNYSGVINHFDLHFDIIINTWFLIKNIQSKYYKIRLI